MANEQQESTPLPQQGPRINKGIKAMQSAPCLSIHCVLATLYVEGDDNLKSRIENMIHEYTETLHNLSAECEVHGGGATSENNNATEDEDVAEEPTDEKPWCFVCDEEFDPKDEGDICVHHPGKRITNPDFDPVAYERENDPETYNIKLESGLDQVMGSMGCWVPLWASTWSCCGEPGEAKGCVQSTHVKYIEGMEDWSDSDSDESD
ncbi:hypothetical protein QBC32DRAFT_373744 [Pseudoneurospora amorphoporcata]|uniref:C2H2-type domain-containing protein n=1 Tax=Pseudoneurospora amorphoporcata TaxID=241081 RepID=A0AAN6SCJ9_9PEZI|nr:hypothetical protein QBC32DRAFT_373744 [Pseudoneurospora amorphoporcata]